MPGAVRQRPVPDRQLALLRRHDAGALGHPGRRPRRGRLGRRSPPHGTLCRVPAVRRAAGCRRHGRRAGARDEKRAAHRPRGKRGSQPRATPAAASTAPGARSSSRPRGRRRQWPARSTPVAGCQATEERPSECQGKRGQRRFRNDGDRDRAVGFEARPKVITSRFGLERSWTLQSYLGNSGYEGLRKALAVTPEEIRQSTLASSILGRAGPVSTPAANGRCCAKRHRSTWS